MMNIVGQPDGGPATPGIILAGGLARRMGGGDKPMRTSAGHTTVDLAEAKRLAALDAASSAQLRTRATD